MGTVLAQPVPLEPVRPNTQDISLRFTPRNANLAWFPLSGEPQTANQYEKDAMEWSLVHEVQPLVQASAPAVDRKGVMLDLGPPACKQAVNYCYFQLGPTIMGRLGVDYEARALCRETCGEPPKGGGIWDVPIDGRHYSLTRICQEKIQICLLNDPRGCAARLGSNRSLLHPLHPHA